MMKNKFIVGLVIAAALAGGAWAAHVENTTTKLDYTVSGGGAAKLTNGTTNLQDLKGQEAIGVLTGTNGTILQIGGLYGLAGVSLVTKGPGEGNAYINNIYLYKEGGHIKIKWAYNYPALTGGAVIYQLVANDFSKTASSWTAVPGADFDSTVTSFDLGADDGKNTYYMVAPKIGGTALTTAKMFNLSPAVPGDYLGKDANQTPYVSWPVAKLGLTFAAGESKLIGYPFRSTGSAGFLTKIADIAAQAGLTDGALWYNSNGLLRVNCNSGAWESNLDVGLAAGYWLMSSAAGTYTFTGALISQEFDKGMVLGSDIYSYAIPLGITDATLKIDKGYENGDALWLDNGGLVKYSYTTTGTPGWDGSFTVPNARGFWYQKVSSGAKLQTIP